MSAFAFHQLTLKLTVTLILTEQRHRKIIGPACYRSQMGPGIILLKRGILMSLVNVGSSTHYSISWDNDPNPAGAPALTTADGPDRANQLLAVCETDFKLM